MAAEAEHILIRLAEARVQRVRYGRANLTFARWSGVTEGALGHSITAYREGNASADDVAAAFVEERLESHTPSFSRENAEPQRLLKLAVEASTEPEFDSAEPTEVARTLARVAEEEWERRKKMRERFERQFVDPFRSIQKVAAMAMGQDQRKLSIARSFSAVPGFDHVGLSRSATQLASFSAGTDMQKRLASWSFPVQPISTTLGPQARLISQMAAETMPWKGILSTSSQPLNAQRLAGLGSDFGLASVTRNLKAFDWGVGGISPVFPKSPAFERFFESFKAPLETWRERFEQALPENWRDLDNEELDAAVELTVRAGPCVAWAPRTEIVRELIAAETEQERRAILEANADDILSDVESALTTVALDELADAVRGVGKVLDAARDGHLEAAQALAGVVVTHLIHDFFELDSFGPLRETFGSVDPWNDVGVTRLTLFAVGRGWVQVLERIPKAGDGFNRNVTLHRFGPGYNLGNLLSAVLLLGGLIPELERLHRRQSARELEPA